MASTYLTTSFKDRERVKALGARWDADQKKWFVPAGRDLAPFANWLPTEDGLQWSVPGLTSLRPSSH